MTYFSNETTVRRVRTQKICEGCGGAIKVGFPATRYVGCYDGFYACHYHPECRRAEVLLNKLHGPQFWPDEWINLSDIEWDDYPWLIEVCPLVAVRMKITTERYNKIRDEQARMSAFWSEQARLREAKRMAEVRA